MSRDRFSSDYVENMSDTTTCSCIGNSLEKCSLRSCSMFQEPFFLHPPGTRPRDGIYINPMSAYIGDSPKPKDTESFYLHSPHDLVYTRITHLFNDTDKSRNGERDLVDKKDETLTVKVDVHINNRSCKPMSNGNAIKSDLIKENGEHAYEQICLRQENDSVTSNKKNSDNSSDGSRSQKTDRRYSRSSSTSECSNMSSEVHYSSTTSTPPLSRNSSNEHINKSPKLPDIPPERKITPGPKLESEKESKSPSSEPSVRPPPPPPPPPPEIEEVLIVSSKLVIENRKDKDGGTTNLEGKSEIISISTTANKSDVQPEVPSVSSSADVDDNRDTCQVNALIGRHMVLPFIPPQFANNTDSNTLLKPSEYLKSICKSGPKSSLSKARSVDNLDIQVRTSDEEEEETIKEEEKSSHPGPPPPPLPPLPKTREITINRSSAPVSETESPKPTQPLATISIQDLTSVQLRRTNKMNATKTFSAPPPRSVSMTNVSEAFFVQKTDLIAELKKTKDIPGIKKLKVERAQVEKTQEQNLISEITKAFNVSNFVDQIPEKDSSGNMIPIWKRQMLARKAAEKAKKELEEQIARENEERRQKAIPPWKRQLLAKKDSEEKRSNPVPLVTSTPAPPAVKIEPVTSVIKKEVAPTLSVSVKKEEAPAKVSNIVKNTTNQNDDSDDEKIIPWRAQLRKTNSTLNILE